MKKNFIRKEPQTVKVTFLVPRESTDETTIAVLEAIVESGRGENSLVVTENFFEALRRAITNWVKNTTKGKKEWECSSQDFNIGDLSSLLPPPPSLKVAMSKEGIHSISIDIHSTVHSSWCFDDILVSESELKS